ncbi:hypothetical protein BC827DRAFT_241059 [Russula dissimulans]|nr:hypothetical protein BC827DRAFT_241059 [Russula dissimulans]
MPHTGAGAGANGSQHFSADLSDRLIVLNVVSYGWGGYHSCRKRQQTLHISANAVLSYVRAHATYGGGGGFVRWDAWAPGHVRVVPRRMVAHETITGMHTLCGMRALDDHIVRDRDGQSRAVVCVYDYHRGRVGSALRAARQQQQQQQRAAREEVGVWTRMRRSLSAKRPEPVPVEGATSYVLPGGENEMPCLVKEIPIPEGLLTENLMCVLSEHAVVLLELSDRRLGAPLTGIFYHAI